MRECSLSRPSLAQAPWAARYNTWLLIKLTLKGVVFSICSLPFVVFSLAQASAKQQSKMTEAQLRAAASVTAKRNDDEALHARQKLAELQQQLSSQVE